MTLRYPLKRREIFCEFKKFFRTDDGENKEHYLKAASRRNKPDTRFRYVVWSPHPANHQENHIWQIHEQQKHIKKHKKGIFICVIKERMKNFHYLCNIKFTRMEDINRLKVVLAEKKRTNKWLAEQLGVNPTTVSKWCTNSSQPDLGNLLRIADLLEVDIKELFIREYKQFLLSQEMVRK